MLMGDFAQIPPVLSTSLMAGMPIAERAGDSTRCLALAGRQTFNEFEDVIRFKRIHRLEPWLSQRSSPGSASEWRRRRGASEGGGAARREGGPS